MKTRISVFLLSLMTFLGTAAQSQYAIHGTVKDQEGIALTGAKIALENTYSGVLSDIDGSYRISGLSNDTYNLTIQLMGYETQYAQVTIADQDVLLDFTMVTSALMIEEIQVSAVRATERTPTTYTNLSTKEIQKTNFGQDLPYLLQGTPSTVVTSDAGAGVGYTGIRIRGVDPTRTNVTINGIPLNDPESHGVYWVDMPDFASSTDNIQIQRGVGTSSNGAAAFGSSINVKSDNIQKNAYAELDNAAGSFNTLRNTVKVGTGLLNNKFSMDARLSRISSDGYIDRATSSLWSYYLSGAYIGKKSVLKANVFSGYERTYQAWWGIPEAKLNGNNDSLLTHFYNNYYSGGMYETAADSTNLFQSDPRTYNYYTYKNEVDNYRQTHYQLHFSHTFSSKLAFNIAGHYTKGLGYYEQHRNNDSLSWYGFQNAVYGTDTVYTTELIRRRWLNNDFYGTIFSFTFNPSNQLKLIFGGAANRYLGGHYGEVIWARNASNSELGSRYYNNDATKYEASGYVKANYQVGRLNMFADLQVRHIGYSYTGVEESYTQLVPLQENLQFTFFNPKAGLIYDLNEKSNIYASMSVANREPVRDDFVQSSAASRPKPEQLRNLEVGYRLRSKKFFVNANYYLMDYKDQLILTGEINDVGAYNRTNVAKSYRMGVELEGGVMLLKNLSLSGNVTVSANKIKTFDEYVDNYDNYDVYGNMIQDVIHHTNTDIAFSPNVISALGIAYEPVKGLDVTLLSKYVGKQFLDNTSSSDRMMDGYFTSNLTMSYTFRKFGCKEVKVGVLVNNLFNAKYANNGYTWGYIYGAHRVTENYYYPQAGRNLLVRLTIKI